MIKKVILGMSGGVDSSVSAVLLKEEGFEVTGVTFQIWDWRVTEDMATCCSLASAETAKKVCEELGIRHKILDLRDAFADKVIEDFYSEYSRGYTPNPCVRCNRFIKFDFLLREADRLGAEYIATGHYARIEAMNNRYILKKGVDFRKDQSYFLYVMTHKQLSRTIFPLGSLTKDRIRKLAREMGLPAAERPESQEICFIPEDNYPLFLKNLIPEKIIPGVIIDKKGGRLGTHKGICLYTVGQRKGLGIAAPKPLYVINIDAETNTIVVGEKEDAYSSDLIADDVNWVAIDGLNSTIRLKARIRYAMKETEATIEPLSDKMVKVRFDEPQWAITPGQSVVFYDGDVVVGGGIIKGH